MCSRKCIVLIVFKRIISFWAYFGVIQHNDKEYPYWECPKCKRRAPVPKRRNRYAKN